MNKAGFMFLIITCVVMMATCEFTGSDQSESGITATDTIFLNQWRKEKAEKLLLMSNYKESLKKMQASKDSLQVLVTESKQSIKTYRFKAKYFEGRLKEKISTNDTTCPDKEVVANLLDSLLTNKERSDTACDNTIETLEKIVLNRDSAIIFHKQIESDFLQIQKKQELETAFLIEKLNIAVKTEKRKTRKSKWLAGGILVLTGITTSLLISKGLK